MKNSGTNQSQRSEEMTEFEATQERALSAAVEKCLMAVRCLKELFDRQVLGRALESIEPTTEDLGPEDRTQAIVKRWLLERDYSTKLTAILLAEYLVADHGTEELAREVMSKYENDIIAIAEDPEKQPNGISVKEIFLSGVVAESLLTNQLR